MTNSNTTATFNHETILVDLAEGSAPFGLAAVGDADCDGNGGGTACCVSGATGSAAGTETATEPTPAD